MGEKSSEIILHIYIWWDLNPGFQPKRKNYRHKSCENSFGEKLYLNPYQSFERELSGSIRAKKSVQVRQTGFILPGYFHNILESQLRHIYYVLHNSKENVPFFVFFILKSVLAIKSEFWGARHSGPINQKIENKRPRALFSEC